VTAASKRSVLLRTQLVERGLDVPLAPDQAPEHTRHDHDAQMAKGFSHQAFMMIEAYDARAEFDGSASDHPERVERPHAALPYEGGRRQKHEAEHDEEREQHVSKMRLSAKRRKGATAL